MHALFIPPHPPPTSTALPHPPCPCPPPQLLQHISHSHWPLPHSTPLDPPSSAPLDPPASSSSSSPGMASGSVGAVRGMPPPPGLAGGGECGGPLAAPPPAPAPSATAAASGPAAVAGSTAGLTPEPLLAVASPGEHTDPMDVDPSSGCSSQSGAPRDDNDDDDFHNDYDPFDRVPYTPLDEEALDAFYSPSDGSSSSSGSGGCCQPPGGGAGAGTAKGGAHRGWQRAVQLEAPGNQDEAQVRP